MKQIVKSYRAAGAIAEYRIVKAGGAEQQVLQAAAAADPIIGVCCQPGGAASGERVDVVRTGMAEVAYGAAVTRGDLMTADADGRAVPAARHSHTVSGGTTAAAAAVRIVGVAEVSGAAGDIGAVLLAPGLA